MHPADPELDLRRNLRTSWSGTNPGPVWSRRRVIGIVLAILGVALFVGMLWQVYMLGRMTGSEDTAPVIQADHTPTKIRPEQPGGLEIPHQDKTVFDSLDGKRRATVEDLLELPEEPLEQNQTGQSSADPENPPSGNPEKTESLFSQVQDQEVMTAPAQSESSTSDTPGTGQEPVESMAAAPDQTAQSETATPETPAESAATEPPPAVDTPVQAVAVIRNTPVPENHGAQPPKPAVTPARKTPPKPSPKSTPKPATTVQASTPGEGSRIQIAAVRTEADARAAVARLQKQFPEDLGTLRFWIKMVEIAGKGTFYRIQAGPVSGSAATALCDKLKARGLGCIIIR